MAKWNPLHWQWKHLLKHSLFVAIVAPLVVIAVVGVVAVIRRLSEEGVVGATAEFIGNVLAFEIPIPIWLLLVGLSFTPLIVWLVRRWRQRRQTTSLEWATYTQDVFHDMLWGWGWCDTTIKDLKAFCPEDETRLVLGEGIALGAARCETCNRTFLLPTTHWDEVMQKIARQIDRKCRTGKWQAAVSDLEDAKAKAIAVVDSVSL